MKKLIALVLLFVLLVTASGQCADWELLCVTVYGKTYISTEDITRSGNFVRAWFKTELFGANELNLTSWVTYCEMDCAENKFRTLRTAYYHSDESVTSTGAEEWQYVVPETTIEAMYRAVCQLQ